MGTGSMGMSQGLLLVCSLDCIVFCGITCQLVGCGVMLLQTRQHLLPSGSYCCGPAFEYHVVVCALTVFTMHAVM